MLTTLKKGMKIGIDPGDGHTMIRIIHDIKVTAEGVHFILKETEKSERRWAKTKRS